jgi:hypothetical protein
MTMDDVKEAYLVFLKAENVAREFKRECENKEEAMKAEADRKMLELKSDIAGIHFSKMRRAYIFQIVGEVKDDNF